MAGRQTKRALTAAVAVCASAALSAAPAQAAPPVTVSTDLGTSCTLAAETSLQRGLILRPVDYTGTIACDASASATASPTMKGSLTYRDDLLLLNVSAMSGQRTQNGNDPDGDLVESSGPTYDCDLAEGSDCGDTGRAQALALSTYRALFSVRITPPPGERFVSLPDGCEALDGGVDVSCVSIDSGTGEL